MSPFRWAALLVVCSPLAAFAHHDVPGFVDELEIVARYDAYGGASFGDVGPYEVISGIVHAKLDPEHELNAGIVDVRLAPRDANGLVSYSEDFVLLRPKYAANAKRVLFYDVVNRGGKVASGTFNGAGASFAAGQQGDALLLRKGYTIVWSGWQGNVPQTGHGDTSTIGASFPVARNRDGSAIVGMSREEFIPDTLVTGTGPIVAPLTYAPATLDKSQVTFNWRMTWQTPQGMQFNSPSTPVPSSAWSYANGGAQVQFTPPAASDAGSIFTFIYPAMNPTVMGIGFAAVRDFVSFLEYDRADRQGHPNPLADLRHAPCSAAHCSKDRNVDVAMMEGVSQSGRFTRDFLWQGFNETGRATHERQVFNGMFPIIPGSRKTYTNFRWAQPGRWSKEHEDHWQPGDQFPFAYNVIRDPVSGATDGILRRCLRSDTCPKVVHLDGGFEIFGARGSLVSTDGAGHDLRIPDNVRLYVVPGANHGGGAGVASLVRAPQCLYIGSAVVESTIDRALVPVLEEWVANDRTPPASKWPSIASNTLASPTSQAAVGFPDLSGVGFVFGGPIYNQLFVTDYSNAIPVADLSKKYDVLIARTDSDGNEIAAVRVPEVAAPLATYASWNVRGPGHAPGEGCYYQSSTVPFASTVAARQATRDPRPSLAERYTSKADYVAKVRAAAESLVHQRLLLEEDVAVYVNAAQAQTLLP
jgi:Alpha/beta hydrolase domain